MDQDRIAALEANIHKILDVVQLVQADRYDIKVRLASLERAQTATQVKTEQSTGVEKAEEVEEKMEKKMFGEEAKFVDPTVSTACRMQH